MDHPELAVPPGHSCWVEREAVLPGWGTEAPPVSRSPHRCPQPCPVPPPLTLLPGRWRLRVFFLWPSPVPASPGYEAGAAPTTPLPTEDPEAQREHVTIPRPHSWLGLRPAFRVRWAEARPTLLIVMPLHAPCDVTPAPCSPTQIYFTDPVAPATANALTATQNCSSPVRVPTRPSELSLLGSFLEC